MLEDMSDRILENISKYIINNISDRIPEDIPIKQQKKNRKKYIR